MDDPIAPIPENYRFLSNLFKEQGCGKYEYDQITINRYLPGQGNVSAYLIYFEIYVCFHFIKLQM